MTRKEKETRDRKAMTGSYQSDCIWRVFVVFMRILYTPIFAAFHVGYWIYSH